MRRIGDVIVTTPVIEALRARFPEARIDFLVEPAAAPVLEVFPGLDERLIFDKRRFFDCARKIRRRRYDWVLDFMNNPRTAQLTFFSGAPVRAGFRVPFWELAYTARVPRSARPLYAVQNKFELLRALGLTPPAFALPWIPVTDGDFEPVRGWWEEQKLDSFARRIAVMPAHRRPIRRWPARRFQELMAGLNRDAGRALIIFGGPGEEVYLADVGGAFSDRVFRAPAAGLRQAAALLARCDAAVTSDNGLMHLAVAVGTPTVTVYGPTWPECWNPGVSPHRWVRAEGLSCLGCNRDECPYGHECMEWVSAEGVQREVELCLAQKKTDPSPLGRGRG